MSVAIKVDDTTVYTIDDTHIKILKSYINEDVLTQHIQTCIMCMVRDTCAQYTNRFKDEWIIKLQADEAVTTAPVATEDFVDMIIARPDYKTKKQQDETPI